MNHMLFIDASFFSVFYIVGLIFLLLWIFGYFTIELSFKHFCQSIDEQNMIIDWDDFRYFEAENNDYEIVYLLEEEDNKTEKVAVRFKHGKDNGFVVKFLNNALISVETLGRQPIAINSQERFYLSFAIGKIEMLVWQLFKTKYG